MVSANQTGMTDKYFGAMPLQLTAPVAPEIAEVLPSWYVGEVMPETLPNGDFRIPIPGEQATQVTIQRISPPGLVA